ncbi:MAG: hypothetical protein PVF70_12965 [Anaerolineales bacterium]|jgi:hypothetical protein
MSSPVKIRVDKPPLRWWFVLLWIIANLAIPLLALFIFTISGGAITELIIPASSATAEASGYAGLAGLSIAFIVTLPITALIAGVVQWLVLRWHVPWARRWLVATAIGVMLGILAGLSVGRGPLGWGILGALIGLAQWFVIRRVLPDAYWWIVVSIVGMVLGEQLTPNRLAFSGVVVRGLPQLVIQLLGPILIWAILSGITLWALSQRAHASEGAP